MQMLCYARSGFDICTFTLVSGELQFHVLWNTPQKVGGSSEPHRVLI